MDYTQYKSIHINILYIYILFSLHKWSINIPQVKLSTKWSSEISACIDSETASIALYLWHCLNLVHGDAMQHIFLRRKWHRQEQKQQHPYQSWMGVEGSSLFLGGWRYQPAFPLYVLHLERALFFFTPLFQITSAAKKARQVVRVDWSWMDFLSLSSLSFSLPSFLFYKAQRLVFHWLQSPSIWMVVCVLSEQRGERPLKRC